MTTCGDTSCQKPSKYYVGDVGTELFVETCEDIHEATVTNIIVKKPGGAVVTWVGSVFETTKIRYVIQPNDFSVAGVYYLQSYVEMPGGRWRGDLGEFRVNAHFE